MNKLIALTVAVSCLSYSALSQASENCPELNKIEEIGSGVFRADGNNGEWSGVLQGFVADRTPVRSFKEVIAIQADTASPIKLQYCTYDVGPDKKLDMRFTIKSGNEYSIKTEGDKWIKETGPIGLIYSVCGNTEPELCIFSVEV